MTDYILFKNLEGKYLTLPECLEVNKTDAEENGGEDGKSAETQAGTSTNEEGGSPAEEEVQDADGGSVEGEVLDADGNPVEEEEEKKEKIVYYVTDEQQQSQYINMFKAAKMDAVI